MLWRTRPYQMFTNAAHWRRTDHTRATTSGDSSVFQSDFARFKYLLTSSSAAPSHAIDELNRSEIQRLLQLLMPVFQDENNTCPLAMLSSSDLPDAALLLSKASCDAAGNQLPLPYVFTRRATMAVLGALEGRGPVCQRLVHKVSLAPS